MRHALLAALVVSTIVAPSLAAQQTDPQSVRRAALDYLEGFYEGDSGKIVRSVRPDVRKVGYFKNRGATTYEAEAMSYAEMIAYANNFNEERSDDTGERAARSHRR